MAITHRLAAAEHKAATLVLAPVLVVLSLFDFLVDSADNFLLPDTEKLAKSRVDSKVPHLTALDVSW